MATIITVHGTFAHLASNLEHDAKVATENLRWWQPNSTFAQHTRQLIGGEHGEVTVEAFVWSGDNSELARRAAGRRLLQKMKELEDREEPYCVVGHSHGGSVIASALMESAARRVPLNHLKKWISVGTPFVELRKERFLFFRLSILMKALFVASLMLLFMSFFSTLAELLDGGWKDTGQDQWLRYFISMGLMAMPFIVFVGITTLLDRRHLYFYRSRIIQRAREAFSSRWLPLLHPEDEAVQGLSSLRTVKFNIFHKTFAVPFLSLASVFILPLAYFYLIHSPTHMVAITNFLRDNVYATENFERVEKSVIASRQQIRELKRNLRIAEERLERADTNLPEALSARAEIRELRERLDAVRRTLHQEHPNLVQMQRTRRFKRNFLERNGQPCEGGTLCGGGHDVLLNSRLLFHLVTDEAASWFIDEEVRQGAFGHILRYTLPILLVPVVFGIAAILLVLLVQLIAGWISALASRWLDNLTWAEVRRSALGNDGEAEVVVGANRKPVWLDEQPSALPPDLAVKITDRSNREMIASLDKFRKAIGELALSEGQDGQLVTALDLLTWKELIHTSYFDVPEFRKLIAAAISQTDGFRAKEALRNDPDFGDVLRWLNEISLLPAEKVEQAA